jgi:hypothetical protein
MTEINEIAIMGQDEIGRDVGLCAICLERFTRFRVEWRGEPLSLILGKQGKGLSPKFFCPQWGLIDTASGADMCADEIIHFKSCSTCWVSNKGLSLGTPSPSRPCKDDGCH